MKHIKLFETQEDRNKTVLEGPFIAYIKETDLLEYLDFTPITGINNPVLMLKLYEAGWAQNRDYITLDECRNVTNIQFLEFAGTSSNYSNFRDVNITDFSAFLYFTSVTSVPTYMFRGCYFTKIKFPNSITSIGGVLFANNALNGVLDLSSTKITTLPVLYNGSFGCDTLKGVILPDTCRILGGSDTGVIDTSAGNRTKNLRWMVLPYNGLVLPTRYSLKSIPSNFRFYVKDNLVDVYKADTVKSGNVKYYAWSTHASKIFPISQFLEDLDNGIISM